MHDPLGTYQQEKDTSEKESLLEVLRQTNGNQTEAARLLGIIRITAWKRTKKHAIDISTKIRG